MTWELAYFDGKMGGKVAVMPIKREGHLHSLGGYPGEEFMQLYPYIDGGASHLWVNARSGGYTSFQEWRAAGGAV